MSDWIWAILIIGSITVIGFFIDWVTQTDLEKEVNQAMGDMERNLDDDRNRSEYASHLREAERMGIRMSDDDKLLEARAMDKYLGSINATEGSDNAKRK